MVRVFDTELQDLKNLILSMGGHVEKALGHACETFFRRSGTDFGPVFDSERQINGLHLQIDQACLSLLAKQAPVAKDLRLVMSIIKINSDLERMGDQTVNIAHNGKDFLKRDPIDYSMADLESMQKKVKRMVKNALDAFVQGDSNLSRIVLEDDDEVDRLRDKVFADLKVLMRGEENQIEACLDLMLTARNLERLADHATNIAEEVIFISTGDDIRHGNQAGTIAPLR